MIGENAWSPLVVVTVFVGLVAALAAQNGILPGHSFPIGGPAVEGVLWALLCFGLSVVYGRGAVGEGERVGKVRVKVGVCVLLALTSTYLCARVMRVRTGSPWAGLGYLGLLVPLAFVVLWCAVVLPRETRALYRARRRHSAAVVLVQLLVLGTAAAALVSATDLAFYATGNDPVATRLKAQPIKMSAWITNSLIVFSAYAMVFAATSRLTTAALLVSPLYAIWSLATLTKIKYMHSAIQPLDLLRFQEFVPLFRSYFGTTTLVVSVVLFAGWIVALATARKERPSPMSSLTRRCLGLLSLATLVLFPVAFAVAPFAPAVERLLILAGAPDSWHREKARPHGLILSFLSEIPATFVAVPHDYSQAAVVGTLAKYSPGDMLAVRDAGRPINLVVYLIESLMDPKDLGLRYTADPIANIRALHGGDGSAYAIVPEAFGGSANTEFEVLTGMTRAFLPNGSLPYRQYVRRAIPSLPSVLRAAGYSTVAIQADPKYYFDRERVYNLLGFDTTVWLTHLPGVARAQRGRWPSDAAAVDAVIRVSRERQPFFAFVFPSSTHAPYHFGTYADSDLDVLDLPAGEARREIKEYINAVREADRAVKALVDHFRRWPTPTLIVILGDHLPPLSSKALQATSLSNVSETDRARLLHRVPLIMWANFEPRPRARELSTSAIAPLVLEKMGVPHGGFLAVAAAVHRKIPVVASYGQSEDGRIWDLHALPRDLHAMIDDYRLLQYDVLLGEQYAVGPKSRAAR